MKSTLRGTAALNSCWNPCNPILFEVGARFAGQAHLSLSFSDEAGHSHAGIERSSLQAADRHAAPVSACQGRALTLKQAKAKLSEVLVSACLLAHARLNYLC